MEARIIEIDSLLESGRINEEEANGLKAKIEKSNKDTREFCAKKERKIKVFLSMLTISIVVIYGINLITM